MFSSSSFSSSWSFNLSGTKRSSTQSTTTTTTSSPWEGTKCSNSNAKPHRPTNYSQALSAAIYAGDQKSSFPVDPKKPIKTKSVLSAALRTMQK